MQDCIPISIDINETAAAFCVMQHDGNSRRIRLTLSDCDNPDEKKINLSEHSARLFCQLPGGDTNVWVDGSVTDGENGVLEFVLTDEITAKEGPVQAQAMVACGSQVIALRRFTFGVLPSLAGRDEIDSWLSELS